MILDKTSFVPLYHQLADILRQQISNSTLQRGEPIPSENELMKQYRISRGTVREGIRLLCREGLLETKRGVGTFVGSPKIEHDTGEVMGFSSALISAGKKPNTQVLKAVNLKPTAYVRNKLLLAAEDEVTLIKRLRFGDGEALLIEYSYYRPEIGKKLLDEDLTSSVYQILRQKYNVNLYRSENSIEVAAADDSEAELLGIPIGSPLMLFKRLVFSDQDLPIEYAEDVYRGDRITFKIHARLQGDDSTGKTDGFH